MKEMSYGILWNFYKLIFLPSAFTFVEETEYCISARASTKLQADDKKKLQRCHDIPYYISFISIARKCSMVISIVQLSKVSSF